MSSRGDFTCRIKKAGVPAHLLLFAEFPKNFPSHTPWSLFDFIARHLYQQDDSGLSPYCIQDTNLGKSFLQTSLGHGGRPFPPIMLSGYRDGQDQCPPSKNSFTSLSLFMLKYSLRDDTVRLGFKDKKQKKKDTKGVHRFSFSGAGI